MKIKNINLLKLLMIVGLSVSFYTGSAIADDDVAALVIDNGFTSVPEPSTLALFLAGAVGIGIVARRNKKDKDKDD